MTLCNARQTLHNNMIAAHTTVKAKKHTPLPTKIVGADFMIENNWREIILPNYEIRKTKAQKLKFIELLSEKYRDRLHVEEKFNLVKNRNIVIGNPETAKIIYTAHYDTCPVLPFPNFITPQNIALYILYQLALTVILLLPLFLLSLAATFFTESLILLRALFLLFFSLEMLTIYCGPANRHTANDNTSGVVTVLTLADKITSPDAAFILFDNEECGLLGSSAYAESHKNIRKNKLIVNLDCVSDGDTLMFAISKKAMETEFYDYLQKNAAKTAAKYGKEALIVSSRRVVYPSDQASFKCSAAAAALKKSRFRAIGLYMDKIHTKHDTAFDERNINSLVELFCGIDYA